MQTCEITGFRMINLLVSDDSRRSDSAACSPYDFATITSYLFQMIWCWRQPRIQLIRRETKLSTAASDRKGGAFPIMLQQFRRAISVAIVRGNAELRRGRLHYVRPTKEEAYQQQNYTIATTNGQDLERTDGSRAMMTTCTAPLNNSRWLDHCKYFVLLLLLYWIPPQKA